MRHGKTSMYINFQQTRVSRSVIIVHMQKNRKLHEFATSNSNFKKKSIILDMHHHKTYMYINFQQNWVSRLVKTVHTFIRRKITRCINLQLPIVIFK